MIFNDPYLWSYRRDIAFQWTAYAVAALFLLFVGAMVGAVGAHAEPPKAGGKLITDGSIVCDTKEQAMSLFKASKSGVKDEMVDLYNSLHDLKDDAGEPTCNLQPILGAIVASVEELGMTKNAIGQPTKAWLVELRGADDASGWALFGEVVPESKSDDEMKPKPQNEQSHIGDRHGDKYRI